jgi:peptidoglycan/xylan/chitin deacetylase (PgdA/CDA1 family)
MDLYRRMIGTLGFGLLALAFQCSNAGDAGTGTGATTGASAGSAGSSAAGGSGTAGAGGAGGVATTSTTTTTTAGTTGTAGATSTTATGTTSTTGTTGTAGAGGSGGAGGGGGSGGSAGGMSKLPVPPGPNNLPKPSGAAANLKVLPWAGFKAAVTYTFDDSQPSQIDHFAEVKATGVPVTYYITTVNAGYPGFDATWKDAFAQGSELGNHTVNHCNFNLTCPSGGQALATAQAEIDGATDYIKTKLGAPDVYTMAYPFGDTGYRAVAQSRFFLGRIAGPGNNNGMVAPGDSTDPFLMPVIPAVGGEPASKFNGDIDATRTQGNWLTFLFHTLLPDAQNWYAGVDIGAVTGSIAHAKSLSDVWIDTFANVGSYWLGQRTLQAVTPSVASGTMTWTWTLPPHFPPGRFMRVTVDGGTLKQNSTTLAWDGHGYYEVALDLGTLSWSP